jgi:hypothetical protein
MQNFGFISNKKLINIFAERLQLRFYILNKLQRLSDVMNNTNIEKTSYKFQCCGSGIRYSFTPRIRIRDEFFSGSRILTPTQIQYNFDFTYKNGKK